MKHHCTGQNSQDWPHYIVRLKLRIETRHLLPTLSLVGLRLVMAIFTILLAANQKIKSQHLKCICLKGFSCKLLNYKQPRDNDNKDLERPQSIVTNINFLTENCFKQRKKKNYILSKMSTMSLPKHKAFTFYYNIITFIQLPSKMEADINYVLKGIYVSLCMSKDFKY